MRKFRLLAAIVPFGTALLVLSACGGGGGGGSGGGTSSSSSSSSSSTSSVACDVNARETELTAAMAALSSDVDFSFGLERSDGRRFIYQRGASTFDTVYESASTSKMVTAMVIWRLIEKGTLKLTDRPQDWIAGWPITATDPLYNMTLAQLMSFTSGLEDEPLCLNNPLTDIASCVNTIATTNAGRTVVPGTRFYYASTHLQVAGLMAMRARGVTTWKALFDQFKAETGLFPTGVYDLPSESNPRLAGGMHWTGRQYLDFLKALKSGNLLNATSMTEYLKDRTALPVVLAYSPAYALGEAWHYGQGYWHECQSATFTCQPAERISSAGAYGAYPYWDRKKNYIGMLARQGALGTFTRGVAETERLVRPQIEAWAACQ
jgi:CubicO group peptidase (beta-lactamase class C family)